METLYTFEYSVLNWIQEVLRCDSLDTALKPVTYLGEAGIPLIILACVLLCFKKTRKAALVAGVAMIYGVIVGNVILKPLVARVRPYNNEAFAELIRVGRDAIVIRRPSDFSFPSGHTLASFETAIGIFSCHKKWGIFAIAVAALIGFTRLYFYVHYFTDVLAGALLGTLFAVAAYYTVNALEPSAVALWKKITTKKQA